MLSRLVPAALLTAFLAGPALAQEKDKDALRLARTNNEFAFHLYSQLAKEPGNLFYSPYSISNALAMTHVGARGQTAEEMKTALRFTLEPDRLNKAWAELIQAINSPGKKRGFQLSVANRLFGQKDYGFLPEFLKTTKDDYGAGLEEVDFIGDTEGARKLINAWVEKATNDKIKDLLKPGVLSEDSRLVLTNAIYFKSAWQHPFQENATKPGNFKVSADKTVKAPMMHANIRTGYAGKGNVAVLRLPYDRGDLAMYILLPKNVDGMAELEKQLTVDNLEQWTKQMGDYMVDVTVPKFKITAEFRLDKELKAMGMKRAFERGQADFSGIASKEKLFISAVVHKAFVDVHEKGTEAAAATGVVVGVTSLPPPATFNADHPFIFLIQERSTGSILFLGRLNDPS